MEQADISVGDTVVPYEDETLKVKVVRISQDRFLVTYQRVGTGENLLVFRVNAGPKPNSIDLDEFDSSFWKVTVDGQERPSDSLEEILFSEEIANTKVLREEREIAFETENS
ncbi:MULTISPECIES: hypothetical protein [Salinibacter]|uniref:hypothetical protein n=1 Tax=Salinibacter TaxID=146918 RepID=UPI001ABA7AD1|nr:MULTISPECIES: hypothetical protein [Salinibacter]